VPEFIDPVFAKTSSKRSFSVIENELVFTKTGSINSGTVQSFVRGHIGHNGLSMDRVYVHSYLGGKQLKMAECLTPDNQHYTILSVAVELCSCDMLFAAKATR
jgi:hypothetical protein